MLRIRLVWLFFFLGSMLLAASTPPGLENEDFSTPEKQRSVISSLLQSGDVQKQAWGAHFAAQYQRSEFIPELLNLLNPLPLDRRQWAPQMAAQYDLNHVILDTLIQLKAQFSAELLTIYFDQYPDELIILLSKHPREQAQLLMPLISVTKSDLYWIALCNIFAKLRHPSFAHELLRDLQIELRICVRDDDLETGLNEEDFGGGCGDGWVKIAEGYPPTGIYELTPESSDDGALFCDGPIPVYCRRGTVAPHIWVGRGYCWSEINRNRYRLEYLATLLGVSKNSLETGHQKSFFIRWQGIDKYNNDLDEMLDHEKEAFAHLKEQLIQRDLLTLEEAEMLHPNIKLPMVVDLRKDRLIPLPIREGTKCLLEQSQQ
jgi:hypothetical protein